MNIEKLREVIRKYEENYNYFNDQAHDEIFKWNAVQHFQNVWLAPKANERSFPELFADARKKCSVRCCWHRMAETLTSGRIM